MLFAPPPVLMFRASGAEPPPPPPPAPEFVAYTSSASDAPTQPTGILEDDWIIAFASRQLDATAPTLGGPFANIPGTPSAAGSLVGIRVGCVQAPSADYDCTGAWTNAQRVTLAVYRNVSAIGSGSYAAVGASAASIAYTALTGFGPRDWVALYGHVRNVSAAPPGLRSGFTSRAAPSSSLRMRLMDSNGVVASHAAESVAHDGGGNSSGHGFAGVHLIGLS